jgi:hypothetical protein
MTLRVAVEKKSRRRGRTWWIDDEESENGEMGIKHCDAIKAFWLCIKWAGENQLALQDILLMKKVKENAQKKYL